jgi:hypothetical protein
MEFRGEVRGVNGPFMNRREFVSGSAALALSRRVGLGAPGSRIDPAALMKRHNPVLSALDPRSLLQVGTGEFAFTCDITGLQTFAESGMTLRLKSRMRKVVL